MFPYGEIGSFGTNPIENANERIKYLEDKTEEDKQACTVASDNRDIAYQNYSLTKKIFNNDSSDKTALERQLKELQEERKLAVKKAREEAEAAGKSQTEIEQIDIAVSNQFNGRINSLMSKIAGSTENVTLSQTDYNDGRSAYLDSRYNCIFTSNQYLSDLSSLQDAYYDKGRLRQSIFLANAAQNLA